MWRYNLSSNAASLGEKSILPNAKQLVKHTRNMVDLWRMSNRAHLRDFLGSKAYNSVGEAVRYHPIKLDRIAGACCPFSMRWLKEQPFFLHGQHRQMIWALIYLSCKVFPEYSFIASFWGSSMAIFLYSSVTCPFRKLGLTSPLQGVSNVYVVNTAAGL